MNYSQKHEKALSLFKADKFKEALDVFHQALQEEPKNPDLWHDRGVCYFHMGLKKEALSDMNTALELQPDYSYRYSSRAYMRGHLKDISGAIEDYKKAIELDPEDAIAYNNLGLLEEQYGYYEQAEKRFNLADELMELLKEKGIDPAEATSERPTNIQREINRERKKNAEKGAVVREMFSVFSDAEKFKEFLSFVKRGFKA